MKKDVLRAQFEKHGFSVSFFDTGKEAARYLAENIQGTSVAIGGSVTVQEMGLFPLLKEHNEVFWHWDVPGRETLKKARTAKIYVTGANAVSETGEIVNIDGTGNRTSQMLYGPEKLYVLVGSNKICPDLESAVSRARNVAAPKNAARLGVKTPCVAAGRCLDCDSPERICHSMVITARPGNGMQAEVVFIGEKLGY